MLLKLLLVERELLQSSHPQAFSVQNISANLGNASTGGFVAV